MTQKTAAATVGEAVTAIFQCGKESLTIDSKSVGYADFHAEAKLQNNDEKPKDLERVFQYFQYNTGTSLDCALATGILRNSITYYISDLVGLGLLGVVRKDRDKTTRHWAYYYSADPSKWRRRKLVQLSFFDIWEG